MDKRLKQVTCYRSTNPNKMLTTKQLVGVAKGMTQLPEEEVCVYRLTHTYDPNPDRAAFVQSSIPTEFMELLVAFIQYECADLDESYAMDQTEVAEVLCQFYGAVALENCEPNVESYKIDLYINWERHCGSNVQGVGMFKRPQMKEFLKKFVDKSKEK